MNMLNKAVVMERYRQVLPVLEELRKEKIPFAVHKGAVLSSLAYGDPFHRIFGDIDLLLPRENIDAVKNVFLSHGFSQQRLTEGGLAPLTRREQIFHLSGTHQAAPFYKETGSRVCPYVCVDINLDIFWGESGKRTDMSAFLADRRAMTLYGSISVPTLSPEKNFLVTCLHHYKDMHSVFLLYTRNGYPFSHLEDIAGFLTHTHISVDTFSKLVRQYGASPYIYACLDAACRILPDFSAPELMEALHTPDAEMEFFSIGLTDADRRSWPGDPADLSHGKLIRRTMDGLLMEKERENIRLNAEIMG